MSDTLGEPETLDDARDADGSDDAAEDVRVVAVEEDAAEGLHDGEGEEGLDVLKGRCVRGEWEDSQD